MIQSHTQPRHLTGRITMETVYIYLFSQQPGQRRYFHLDSRELKAAGYTWEPLTDCAGILRFNLTRHFMTPRHGSNDKPLVLEVPCYGGAPTGPAAPPQTSAKLSASTIAAALFNAFADVVAAYRPLQPISLAPVPLAYTVCTGLKAACSFADLSRRLRLRLLCAPTPTVKTTPAPPPPCWPSRVRSGSTPPKLQSSWRDCSSFAF